MPSLTVAPLHSLTSMRSTMSRNSLSPCVCSLSASNFAASASFAMTTYVCCAPCRMYGLGLSMIETCQRAVAMLVAPFVWCGVRDDRAVLQAPVKPSALRARARREPSEIAARRDAQHSRFVHMPCVPHGTHVARLRRPGVCSFHVVIVDRDSG